MSIDPHFLRELREGSGLTDATILAAQFQTTSDPDRIARYLNWRGAAHAAELGVCLLIPYRGWDGKVNVVQVKPSHPRANDKGKVNKYEWPAKTPHRLYIPPPLVATLKAADTLFVVTEGVKKSLAAWQHGINCVSIAGVDAGCNKGKLIADLAEMNLDRIGAIVFDSDASTKPQVRKAAHKLQAALRVMCDAVDVRWVPLPPKADGTKMGLDDFLMQDGGAEELRRLMNEARDVPTPHDGELWNYDEVQVKGEKGKDEIVEVPRAAADILSDFTTQSHGYPVAVGGSLYAIRNDRLIEMGNESQLFSFAASIFDSRGRSGVNGLSARGAKSKKEFFCYAVQNAKRYDAAARYPHYPPVPGILYAPYTVSGGDGTAFEKLISFFNPATEIDRLLLMAAFMTPLWGGKPGKRPAFVFVPEPGAANQGRQTGKSTAAAKISRLYGGHYDLNTNVKWPDFVKGLINSASGNSHRIVVWDNVKTRNVSWSDLEGFITAPEVSGHHLFKGNDTIPNYFTTILTMNGATCSTDIATRSQPVHFAAITFAPTWEAKVDDFIDATRTPGAGSRLASTCSARWTPRFADSSATSKSPPGSTSPPNWQRCKPSPGSAPSSP